MADSTTLNLTPRTPEGSRSTRRLRRQGLVPGVIYGGGDAPEHFAVDARILRNTLARAGQIIEVELAGGSSSNVLIKDVQRHPVRGEAVHVDLLRVRMDEKIHATVPLEFTGAEESPGVTEGGIFNQELRELAIEALPGDIPDSITLRRLRPGDERHGHARRAHRTERRRAARRRRGGHRHDHAADARARRGGDRDGDRGRRRRGRRGRRGAAAEGESAEGAEKADSDES